jgi:hypothetical protein
MHDWQPLVTSDRHDALSSGFGAFLGLDVSKDEHHAVGLDPAGKRLHDGPLPNSEPKLRALFDKLAAHGPLLVMVDQPATIGALPVAVNRAGGAGDPVPPRRTDRHPQSQPPPTGPDRDQTRAQDERETGRRDPGSVGLKRAFFFAAFAALKDPTTTANAPRARPTTPPLLCLARRRCDVLYAMLRNKTYYRHPENLPAAA